MSVIKRLYHFILRTLWGFDFFISYGRKDAASYAESLENRLMKEGFKCFRDEHEIPPGEILTNTIEKGLKMSTALLLIASPEAVKSEHVRKELSTFSNYKKTVIPISIGNTLKDKPFKEIENLLWIDETENNMETGMPKKDIVKEIKSYFKHVRRRKVRNLTLASVFFVILSLLFSVVWNTYKKAEREKQISNASTAVIIGERFLNIDPGKALAYAYASLEQTYNSPAQDLIKRALKKLPESRIIKVEDRKPVNEIEVFPSNFYGVNSIHLMKKGNVLLLHHSDDTVTSWDVPTGTKIETIGNGGNKVKKLIVDHTYPSSLFVLYEEGKLEQWRIRYRGKLNFQKKMKGRYREIMCDTSGEYIIAVQMNGHFENVKGTTQLPQENHLLKGAYIYSLSPNARRLAVLNRNLQLRVYNLAEGGYQNLEGVQIDRPEISTVDDIFRPSDKPEWPALVRELTVIVNKNVNFIDILKIMKSQQPNDKKLDLIKSKIDPKKIKDLYHDESSVKIHIDDNNQILLIVNQTRWNITFEVFDLVKKKSVWKIKRNFASYCYHPRTFKLAVLSLSKVEQFTLLRNMEPKNINFSQLKNPKETLKKLLLEKDILIDKIGEWKLQPNEFELGRGREILYSPYGEYLVTLNATIFDRAGPPPSTVKLWFSNKYTDHRAGDIHGGRLIGSRWNKVMNLAFNQEGNMFATFSTDGMIRIYTIFPERAITVQSRANDYFKQNQHLPLFARYLLEESFHSPEEFIKSTKELFKIELDVSEKETLEKAFNDRSFIEEILFKYRAYSIALQNSDDYVEIKPPLRSVPGTYSMQSRTYDPFSGNKVLNELLDDTIKGKIIDDEKIAAKYLESVENDLILLTGVQNNIILRNFNAEDAKTRSKAYVLAGLTGDRAIFPDFQKAVEKEIDKGAKQIGFRFLDFLDRYSRDLSLNGKVATNPELAKNQPLLSLPTIAMGTDKYKLLLPGGESSTFLPWSKNLRRIIFSQLERPKDTLSLGAITVANYLTGYSPNEFQTKVNFIVMLRDAKAYNAAQAWCKYFLRDSSISGLQKSDIYNLYGYVLYLSGEEHYPEAIDNYRLSIELGRNDGWPEKNIAQILEKQGQKREAIQVYGDGLKKAKLHFEKLSDKYKTYQKSDNAVIESFSPPSKKIKKLLLELEKVFKELPGFYNALAWSIVTTNKEQLEREELERANQLAGIGCQMSLKYHEKFLGKKYIDPNILDTYATTFAALGNYQEAVEHEKAAYQLSGEEEFLKKINQWESRLKKND